MAKKVLTYKRGSLWAFRFEGAKVDGKRQWISRSGFPSEDDAYTAGLAAYNEYQNTGMHVKPTEMSMADFLDLWLRDYCDTNLKDTTLGNYRKRINNLIKPTLGRYQLRAIRTNTVQRFLDDLFNQGYSRNSLACVKGILSKSFKYAKKNNFIRDNPMYEVDLPLHNAVPKVKSRRKERVYLPPATIRAIFERFPEGSSAHLALILGYRCGLRLGEVFGLQWCDVDFDRRTLTVRRQLQYEERTQKATPKEARSNQRNLYFAPPKYNSVRTIDVDGATLELLRRTKRQQAENRLQYGEYYVRCYMTPEREKPEDPTPFILNTGGHGGEIFPVLRNQDGSPIRPTVITHASRVIHGWKQTQKDGASSRELDTAPICPEFDFHSLRHTHCTDLLLSGVDPKSVQLRLGHKDIKTTLNIYEHITAKRQEETAAKLDQLYAAN